MDAPNFHNSSVLLQPGVIAPDFTLKSTPDQSVSLSEFRGAARRARVLSSRLEPGLRRSDGSLQRSPARFSCLGRNRAGISVDGTWCHAAFARDHKLHFPLLSDFEPKGEVARRYGVYRPGDGTCERALFVLDQGGNIHWSHLSPVGVNPGADGILSALEELQSKETK